jgi:hypothetical protein
VDEILENDAVILTHRYKDDRVTSKLVVIISKSDSKPFEEIADNTLSTLQKMVFNAKLVSKSKIRIDKMNGLRSEYHYSLQNIDLQAINYQIHSPTNNKVYTLGFTIPEKNFARDSLTIEKIVRSIKPAKKPVATPKVTDKATVETDETLKGYEKILLTDVGYIPIPSELELQSGNYKDFVESGQKLMAQKFKFEISDNRIVFQQKGINSLYHKGFSSYVRVIIETSKGSRGDYMSQTDNFSASAADIAELSAAYKQQMQATFKGTALRLIKWQSVSIVDINGSHAIKMSYIRQMNDQPYVQVDMYQFHNNDRMHTLTLSY